MASGQQAEKLLEALPELGWLEPYANIAALYAAVEEDIRLEDERLSAVDGEQGQAAGESS